MPTLVLDAGDFAADPDPGDEIFTEGLVEGMRRIGYAAVALGSRELAGGEPVRAALRSSGVQVLAANLPRKVRREWGAEPYTVVETAGYSVGIIGMAGALVTDFQPGFHPRLPDAVPTADYLESLERTVAKLSKRCSVLVVLTQADMGKAIELLQAVPQIDVLVSSTEAYLGREPVTVGRSVMVFGGTEGKRLGHLHLEVYPNRSVGVVWGRSVRLSEKIAEDPDARQLVRRTTARANAWHRARAQAALATADVGEGVADGGPYRTAAACRDCHDAEYEVWKASTHASAMRVLEEGSQDFLPKCVSCHVTGMGEPGGFRDRLATPKLVEVQCEACHGPAARHLEDPSLPYGPAGLTMCAETCHTPEQTSGHFAAEEEWQKIRH